MNLALNEPLMWAQCVKKAVTQDPYVLMKCSSLFCLGTAMNCDVIWLDASNIQWGEGIIHLTANGLEHQVQFHCTLGSTHTAYFELATSTEAVKNLQISLLFVFRYRPCKHPGPRSQMLLNSGPPTTCAADPDQQGIKLWPHSCCLWSTKSSTTRTSRCKKQKKRYLYFFLNPSQQI